MRINLYGGPGVGKSTLAAEIFACFKKAGEQIELVQEWAKLLAYAGKRPTIWDQVEGFSRQLRTEEKLQRMGVSVVTDSPLRLQAFYATRLSQPIGTGLYYAAVEFDREFPPVELLIKRKFDYDSAGRFESLDAAKEIDEFLGLAVNNHIEPSLDDALRIITFNNQ